MAAIGKIRSWGPWLVGIIGLALFGFIATDFTRQCETSSNQARQQVGKVMGEKLSIQDLQNRAEEYKNLVKVLGGDVNEEVLRDQAWNDFVTNTILGEEAKKLGLGVTDEEMKAILSQGRHPALPTNLFLREFFNQAGEFDYNNVTQLYAALQQQAPEQFREFQAYWETIEKIIRQNLLTIKYQTLLQACMLTNEQSAKQAFDASNSETEIQLASLAYSTINDNDVKISDDDLRAKYNEMKENFRWDVETRDIKYVVCNVVPSDEDIANLNAVLDEAAKQFAGDSISTADVVATHRSVVAYRGADMPYNANGLRNISADLLKAVDSVADNTVTAPFKYVSMQNGKPIEHMAIAKLNRRYQDVDTINYKYINVGGTSFEDAEKRADSLIAVIKGGESIDSVAQKMGQPVQTALISADTYQNKESLTSDDRALISNISKAAVGEPQRVSLTGSVRLFIVNERHNNTLYDVAIVSNEVRFSNDTDNKTYNDFSQFVSSCSNIQDLEAKAPQAGYDVQEQKNLLSTANYIGTYVPLANSRDAVKWVFAKASEGSISEIMRDPAEGRFMVVAVTNVNPKGYLDQKSAEPYLRAELMKDKKAEMLIKQLAGATTVEAAEQKGASVDSINSISFPTRVSVGGQMEKGLSGAVAATAVGQTVKNIVKGDNGVYLFKVLNRTNDSEKEFNRREQEADMMRNLVWLVTPSQQNSYTNFMEVLVQKAKLEDNRFLF